MFLCMRTTLDIQDDVLLQYKRIAAESNRPLKEVVEEALRSELLRRSESRSSGTDERVITFKGNGLEPGVNLDSGVELRDYMDES